MFHAAWNIEMLGRAGDKTINVHVHGLWIYTSICRVADQYTDSALFATLYLHINLQVDLPIQHNLQKDLQNSTSLQIVLQIDLLIQHKLQHDLQNNLSCTSTFIFDTNITPYMWGSLRLAPNTILVSHRACCGASLSSRLLWAGAESRWENGPYS